MDSFYFWIKYSLNSTEIRLCLCESFYDCFVNEGQYKSGFWQKLLLKDGAVPTVHDPATPTEVVSIMHLFSKLPFWKSFLALCKLLLLQKIRKRIESERALLPSVFAHTKNLCLEVYFERLRLQFKQWFVKRWGPSVQGPGLQPMLLISCSITRPSPRQYLNIKQCDKTL